MIDAKLHRAENTVSDYQNELLVGFNVVGTFGKIAAWLSIGYLKSKVPDDPQMMRLDVIRGARD